MKTFFFLFCILCSAIVVSCSKEKPRTGYHRIELNGTFTYNDSIYDYDKILEVNIVKETQDSLYVENWQLSEYFGFYKDDHHIWGTINWEGNPLHLDGRRNLIGNKICGKFESSYSWKIGPGNAYAYVMTTGDFKMKYLSE